MNKIEDTLFKEGLMEEDLLKLRKAPKVEAHNHCGLGMRFSTFNKWAGGMVNEPPKRISTEDLNTMLIPCIDSGVFKSIDLYGDEAMENFERFKEYYKYAKQKGLKLKAHAGEFQGAENVNNH
ncbi:hypothetical protein LGK97_08055 [Clostridium sp. CS001]|uniref:hypothetical protein n=1 Tax=Clostridium sp. CS001 TaxID=2880648 RepID=UPI001CF5494C|nr:hypothetical protein [Clostridium sp. CS001]MCB2289716.1 hypothetical protein [Clostridium sp. CS001]